MDAVEVFLFCLVGLSVSVFFLLENLEKGRRKPHQHEAAATSAKEEDERPVGGDRDEAVAAAQVTSCSGSTVIAQVIGEENGGKLKHSSEKSGLLSASYDNGVEDEKEGHEWFDDDDCEGVERTELEKAFGEAVVFVGCDENADRIGDEQRQRLYGLQKVAFEGACRVPQPMLTVALNAYARSKWNFWRKGGSMSREEAMERYVDVLSEAVPGWKKGSY